MENANPPSNTLPELSTEMRLEITRELNLLKEISSLTDNRLNEIDQHLNRYAPIRTVINAEPLTLSNIFPKPNSTASSSRTSIEKLKGNPNFEYFNTFPSKEELEYHSWLLKYPKPSWVVAKVRVQELDNVKITCMIGHFIIRQAFIDFSSPINVMSRQQYNIIMRKTLEARRKLTNNDKIANFTGRVKGIKVFVGDFSYECDFVIVDDITSVIEEELGELVFGKPFINTTGLSYDAINGTVRFGNEKRTLTFQMPPKIESDVPGEYINTNVIPSRILEDLKGSGRAYYLDSLMLGNEYNEDESISEGIRELMHAERDARLKEESEPTE